MLIALTYREVDVSRATHCLAWAARTTDLGYQVLGCVKDPEPWRAAECPEKRTGQRFWTAECSTTSWKENGSKILNCGVQRKVLKREQVWTEECNRMSWKENGSKILNRRVQQNVMKREHAKDSEPRNAAECPEKRQLMSSWSRSSPAIQWTVHRLLPLTSFRDALKLWNIYKLAGSILPFTMWTWLGAGMYQNCPQAFAGKKILIKKEHGIHDDLHFQEDRASGLAITLKWWLK